MTTRAKAVLEPVSEEERVFAWRFERFLTMGFGLLQSEMLADNRAVDLHEADELVQAALAKGTRHPHTTLYRLLM